jgi:hypothetical protein
MRAFHTQYLETLSVEKEKIGAERQRHRKRDMPSKSQENSLKKLMTEGTDEINIGKNEANRKRERGEHSREKQNT